MMNISDADMGRPQSESSKRSAAQTPPPDLSLIHI